MDERQKAVLRKLSEFDEKVCKEAAKEPNMYKAYITDVVCDMFRCNQPVTVDTLIAELSHRQDSLAEEKGYGFNVDWHLAGAAISFLQGLTAKKP